MPRQKSYSPQDVLDAALQQFWTFGYHGTSIDDLVKATGVSRHGLYSAFPDKHALFLACLAHYRERVVDPAFRDVEQTAATISDIGTYFDTQIGLAEQAGLPGPGCLFANTATEVAPHDGKVKSLVAAHNARLSQGFARAIRNSAPPPKRKRASYHHMAASTLAFANGLWGLSRLVDDAAPLRSSAKTFLKLLDMRVHDDNT
jgi:TetR/AcrR family transcriptional regulator, transcriptional repressor for nem operon